jgi:hypothetical protein
VSVLGLFTSLFNYIIDCYLWSAASALAGSTVVRSTFGAGFPLFGELQSGHLSHRHKLLLTPTTANQMYASLGTQWASSLLGFIALAMTPVPLVLIKYGPTLRARSKFTPSI